MRITNTKTQTADPFKMFSLGIGLVLVTIILLISPPIATACSPAGPLPSYSIKEHVDASHVVFLGEVIQHVPDLPDHSNPIYTAKIKVADFYKGSGGDTVTMKQFGQTSLCLQEVPVGGNYLFFGTIADPDEENDFDAVYFHVNLAAIEVNQANIEAIKDAINHPNPAAADHILWQADMEEGTLYDWFYDDQAQSGGGVFNTGDDEVIAQASTAVARSGHYSAEATITNAYRAQNGSRAVRLMRWTDKPWAGGGDYFPADAYYSTWMYIPTTYNVNKYAPWDPGDGGWWNVFQFKSDDENDESQPIWTLNIAHDDLNQTMVFYAYTKYNTPASHAQSEPIPIPVGRWFHVEARYVQSANENGRVTFWQDGVEILDVDQVNTILSGNAVWGIGNYTDHIVGGEVDGTATIFFDDAIVSTQSVAPRFKTFIPILEKPSS